MNFNKKCSRHLGFSDEEIEAKFGFLVEAYKYGPHLTAVWVSVLTDLQ